MPHPLVDKQSHYSQEVRWSVEEMEQLEINLLTAVTNFLQHPDQKVKATVINEINQFLAELNDQIVFEKTMRYLFVIFTAITIKLTNLQVVNEIKLVEKDPLTYITLLLFATDLLLGMRNLAVGIEYYPRIRRIRHNLYIALQKMR